MLLPQPKTNVANSPTVTPAIVVTKISSTSLQNLDPTYQLVRDSSMSHYKIFEHSILLTTSQGLVDQKFQYHKIKNLALAAGAFDNLVIKPGQTFSFWKNLGRPTKKRGFVQGMIIDNGRVVEVLGGGLSLAADMLYWMALHSPLTISQKNTFQGDLLPDTGRSLSYGTGSGVLYDHGDLLFTNHTDFPIILRLWLENEYLQGQIWSDSELELSYKVTEKDHRIYKKNINQKWEIHKINKLYRVILKRAGGIKIGEELIALKNSKLLFDPS